MKRQIACDRRQGAREARGPSVYHELDARPLLGDVEHVHRAGLRALRPEEHRRRGRLRRHRATRSSRPSTSSPRAPTSIVLADIGLLRRRRRATVAARPGWSTSRGGADRLDRPASTTRSRRAGGRGSSTSSAPSASRAALGAREVEAAAAGHAPSRPRCAGWRRGGRLPPRRARSSASLVGPVRPRGRRRARSRSLAQLPFLARATRRSPPTQESILWDIRVPRVVLGALVGAMLALAGASYQGVFRNPLADPYLLGVAAGAGLGATIAIVYLPTACAATTLLPPAAFVGGAVAVVARLRDRPRRPAASAAARRSCSPASPSRRFFTAVQTFVQQQHSDTLQEVYSWILGSLPSSGWRDVRILAAVRRRRDRRDPAAPAGARRAQRRRRRGGEPRRRRRAASGSRSSSSRHGRHGGRRRRQRADRLRRDHRPARDPPRRRRRATGAPAAVGASSARGSSCSRT